MTEILSLVGVVCATVFAMNFSHVVAQRVSPWIWFNQTVAGFLVFLALFLILIFFVHVILRRIAEVIKWERLHWAVQGLGLVVGAVRGLWWSGFILAVLTLSGVTYLQESVEQRSVLGPRLAQHARARLEEIADRFPGASLRGPVLIPPMKPRANKK